LIKYELK